MVDEFIGSLMTYELKLKKTKEPKPSKKTLALKVGSSKQEALSDESFYSEKDSDEFAMFTRNFKKFLRREGKSFRRKSFSSKKSSKPNSDNLKKSDKIIYYNCRRSGHIQLECPELQKMKQGKKKTQKPKAMICTWSDEEEDDDEDTSSDEEDKKLCLMDIVDEEDNDQVTSSFENYFNSY